MESLQETYQSLRSQPLKIQIPVVAVAVVLTLLAILIPLLIRPSSDPDATGARTGSYDYDEIPYEQSGPDSGWIEMPSGDTNEFPPSNEGNEMPASDGTDDFPASDYSNEFPPAPDYNNMGSGSTDTITESCGGHMTDKMRRRLLRIHNKQRSKVAKGHYRIDAPGSALQMLPPAVRMYQLKYNCSLERSALNWAGQAQCQMIHSQWPGLGENLYASGSPRSFMYSANESVVLWADEIRKYGVQQDINEWSHETGHATQIFWDTTYSVGCGIIKCDDDQTSVVCHYYPQGNFRGMKWYTAGKTLSECGKPRKPYIPDDAPEGFVPIGEFNEETHRERERQAAREVPHYNTGLCEILT